MKQVFAGLFLVFVSSAYASAQTPTDPCRLNDANSQKALTLGYYDFLRKDSAFQAAWSAWTNAGTTVTRMETDAIDPSDIRRRVDAKLAHRDMILKANLFLRQKDLDIICGEVIKLRVAQAASGRLRPQEISFLQQATGALQKKASLGTAEFRILYNKETDAVLAESKDSQRASTRIANEIKAATGLRNALRAAGGAK